MRIFRKIVKLLMPDLQMSYAQFGEDLILSHLFHQLDIKNPTYLDIGANEPRYISNTYFFYLRGSRGILIEPNPFLFKKLKKMRPKDIVLNTGIGFNETAQADFFVFPNYANGLNTFSEKEARHWENIGMKGLGKIPIEKIIKMPLVTVNNILEQHFNGKSPNFISLDVEGLDLEILKSIDYTRIKPEVICVETLAYDEDQKTFKLNEINLFLKSMNYEVYADTRVNTIFCRKDLFIK